MTYQAIGMPEVAAQVRAIAPHNLIILSGRVWSWTRRPTVPVPSCAIQSTC